MEKENPEQPPPDFSGGVAIREPVIARSSAMKSPWDVAIHTLVIEAYMDCFATLAMTATDQISILQFNNNGGLLCSVY